MKQAQHTGSAERAQTGMTLVELLVTLLILAMAGMIVVTGIPAAQHAYQRAVDAANAQAVLSMTTDRLRDVLSTADPSSVQVRAASDTSETIAVGNGETVTATARKSISFKSLGDGRTTTIVDYDTLGLYVKYSNEDLPGGGGLPSFPPTPLISEYAAVGAGAGASLVKLVAHIDGNITPSDSKDTITINDITVNSTASGQLASAEVDSLTIKLIAS